MADGTLSFEEFWKLSEAERGERYKDLSDHDRFRVRISMNSGARSVMCNVCAYYHNDFTCDAYPDEIPAELVKRGEHDTPFPGDRGYRFKQK